MRTVNSIIHGAVGSLIHISWNFWKWMISNLKYLLSIDENFSFKKKLSNLTGL